MKLLDGLVLPLKADYGQLDELFAALILVLRLRNWVSEYQIRTKNLDSVSPNSDNCTWVTEVRGSDFVLKAGRAQGNLYPGRVDDAALKDIIIPRYHLYLPNPFDPWLYVYVGKHWDKDQDWWYNGVKSQALLRGEPRRYLVFRGNREQHGYDVPAPVLLPMTAEGTHPQIASEYAPLPHETQQHETPLVLQMFTEFMAQNVFLPLFERQLGGISEAEE